MSATPFADQRTTAGDTGILSSRIIYNFCFCKPLCTPSVSTGVRRVAFNMTHCEPFCAENWFQGCFEQHLLSSMRAQFDDKAGKKFIHDMNEVFT